MVGKAAFLGLSVLLCLTDSAVSVLSKCRVASFRVVGSFSSSCDIQFGYTTAPPDWIDQLQVVESFKNATDEQLDDFAKDACRCRMLRVHRHCSSDLFELVKAVAWRCFPGAREAVKKDIASTIAAREQPSGEEKDGGQRVYQLGGEERGDGDQGSTDSLKTTDEGGVTKEESTGTEEMSTTALDMVNIATYGATVTTNGQDESSDVTSVDSVDVPPEESDEDSLEIIPKDSSEAVTQVPTSPAGAEGRAEESFESISEGSSGAGIEDTMEGPAEDKNKGNKDTHDVTDPGTEEVEEEYEDLEGSAEEDTGVSSPAP